MYHEITTCPPCPNNSTSTSPVATRTRRTTSQQEQHSHSGHVLMQDFTMTVFYDLHPCPKCYPQFIHNLTVALTQAQQEQPCCQVIAGIVVVVVSSI